ncbi:MAG: ribose-phosphate pyrophosphokinase [Gemmatimonadaceae bacterium]
MRLLLLPLPGNEKMCDALEAALGHFVPDPPGRETVAFRRFPDGESYVRINTPIAGRAVAIVCTLDRPDDKVLPLLFLVETARDLGAASVGLIAPYLAYMRQDRRFIDGEGVTSAYFAALLSRAVDWLVTVDPHLHRRASLSEIYSIPAEVVRAAPHVAGWIRSNVQRPLLIGPDEESAQWVAAVAEAAGAPSVVLQKVRRGDRDVSVTVPDLSRWRDHTPVLVDDIVSTARTMIETVHHLQREGVAAPVCVAVHPVFVAGAYDELRRAGAARIVSCNTIPHPSNAIDLSSELAGAVDARYAVSDGRPG